MPGAMNLVFLLYLLVSIVTGIVSAVRKRSQTTRGRRPAYAPGQPAPPVIELDLHDAGERPSPAILRQPPPREMESPLRREREDGLGHGSLEGPDTEGVSLEWGDLEVPDTLESRRPTLARLPATRPPAAERSRPVPEVPVLPVRRLSGNRARLKEMIVAMEVIGKPKGLTM